MSLGSKRVKNQLIMYQMITAKISYVLNDKKFSMLKLQKCQEEKQQQQPGK